ncbi:MAG: SDR family oxidoreductase [Gammaproteobacteria bacterium]|nr:SDR family oxidoreductase [Gammaproteobacteria bacterium]
MTESRQTILITGASSGIGEACVKTCLDSGYIVIGVARDFTKSDIQHEKYYKFNCDLNNTQQLENSIKTIIKEHNPQHFLHSAGFGRFGSLEQFSTKQIIELIQVNLISAILISRLLLPSFRKTDNSKMIFIGSESAKIAGKKGAVYCASKFGLRGFTESLREDCAANKIGVNLINPGMVRSPFFKSFDFQPGHAQQHAIAVEEVARVVNFLLNTDPNFVIDEINLSPAIKNIDFSKKAE